MIFEENQSENVREKKRFWCGDYFYCLHKKWYVYIYHNDKFKWMLFHHLLKFAFAIFLLLKQKQESKRRVIVKMFMPVKSNKKPHHYFNFLEILPNLFFWEMNQSKTRKCQWMFVIFVACIVIATDYSSESFYCTQPGTKTMSWFYRM